MRPRRATPGSVLEWGRRWSRCPGLVRGAQPGQKLRVRITQVSVDSSTGQAVSVLSSSAQTNAGPVDPDLLRRVKLIMRGDVTKPFVEPIFVNTTSAGNLGFENDVGGTENCYQIPPGYRVIAFDQGRVKSFEEVYTKTTRFIQSRGPG